MSVSYNPTLGYLAFAILTAIFGAYVGSFCSKLIYRLEGGRIQESKILSKSFCPSCGKKLSLIDTIPFLSYLRLGGKCRRCGAPITKRYLVLEGLGLVLPFVVGYFYNYDLSTVSSYFFLMALICNIYITWDRYGLPDLISCFILILAGINAILKVIPIVEVLLSFVSALLIMYFYETYLERSSRESTAFFFGCIGAYLGFFSMGIVFTAYLIVSQLMRFYAVIEQKKARYYNLALCLIILVDFCFKEQIAEQVLSVLKFLIN